MKRLKPSFKSNFLKNVLIITSGTAFAQFLSILLLPVITRLYSPEQYGVISVYVAILFVISFLGSMNYEMGVPIAESEVKAINVLSLSVVTLTFSTVLLYLIFIFIGDQILYLFNGEVLIDYKYLIPLGTFLVGLYSIFTQWAYREKDFKAISKTKFTQAILQNLVAIGFGLLGKGPIGLIFSRIWGQSAGITTLSFPLIQKKDLLNKIKKQEIIQAARRYINFPLYATPRRFLGDITISLPVLFLTSLYDFHVVGMYGLANSVIQLPMNLIGSSVSNVFYAESASLRSTDPKKVKELSKKLLINLIIVGIIPLITLLFIGSLIFSFVFGSIWSDAGIYASLLSIVVFSRLIFKPISNIFDIYEKQKLALLLNIFRLVLVLITFGISSYYSLNSYWAVGLFSLSMSIVYFIQYLLAQKVLNDEINIFQSN